MNSKLFKGILLIAGVFYAALQSGNVVWATTITTAICVGGGYFVKNLWIPSISDQGKLNWQDIASGLLLALFAGVGDSISSLIVNGQILWPSLGKEVLSVALVYLTTTFFSGSVPSMTPAKK